MAEHADGNSDLHKDLQAMPTRQARIERNGQGSYEGRRDRAVEGCSSGPFRTMEGNNQQTGSGVPHPTVIDVFTGWVEIIPITTKKSEVIGDLFVQE